jgi:hypothetical protein
MDVAFRVGQARTSLDTMYQDNVFVGSFDLSGTYFGAAGGAGWRTPVCDQLELDFYTRLMWSHQGTDDSHGSVEFAEANSTRFTFGTRADFQAGEGRVVYAGAAWEYEFNGRAELNIDDPGPFAELGGGSLAGEVGLKFLGEGGFSASLGLEGALGRREALGGVLRLGYEF